MSGNADQSDAAHLTASRSDTRLYKVPPGYIDDYAMAAIMGIQQHGVPRRRFRMLYNWGVFVLRRLLVGIPNTALGQLFADETWEILQEWFCRRPPDLSD